MISNVVENLWLRLENVKEEFTIGAKIFACFCAIDFVALLICNVVGLKIFAIGSIPLLAPFWPIKMVALFLGPFTILLTFIGFGVSDIGQEFLPPSWKNEIETTAAMKVTAHLIGIDVFALAVAYYLDPRSAPLAYTLTILGTIILIYRMSPFPKSVFKSKGK